jgi:hypothetical protein
MSSVHKTTIRFTAPQWCYLEIEADRLGVTVAELVRRIVDSWRDERERRRA